MTAASNTDNIAHQLAQISRKRAALEQLLLLAHQLSRMQGGMGMLQQMLKPSQAPGRKASSIEQLCAALAPRATDELRRQLTALDESIARELSSVVVLSRLTRAEFIQRYCESKGAADAAALLEKQLEEFRRNSQLNVAVRYVLHGRGIQLKAADLPISQEAVAQRLDALRTEEQQCRQQITQQAQELLVDIEAAVANPACTAAELARQLSSKLRVENTLRMLAQGRGLEELPRLLDADVDAVADAVAGTMRMPAPPAPKSHDNPQATAKTLPAVTVPAPDSIGLWEKFKLWLNTPWETRWKDIDKKK
jgi:hypothetical protein